MFRSLATLRPSIARKSILSYSNSMAFSRLVRFRDSQGNVHYGDISEADPLKATKAKIVKGDINSSYTVTSETAEIKELLCPIALKDVRTLRCLGLNYEQHAKESGAPIPKYPVLFFKPIPALASATADIPVCKLAQVSPEIDYECELVVIIGKQGKDIPEEKALDYVLGYVVGDDISQRGWQLHRGGGQWGTGKMFDGWAPISGAIVSPEIIKDPNNLRITTKVNGQTVQDSTTKDMIFNVKKIINFISQGTTLLPGDVIMTGTPQGVGMGRKPQLWLKDGDVVEVELENVGKCVNKVVFEKDIKSKL